MVQLEKSSFSFSLQKPNLYTPIAVGVFSWQDDPNRKTPWRNYEQKIFDWEEFRAFVVANADKTEGEMARRRDGQSLNESSIVPSKKSSLPEKNLWLYEMLGKFARQCIKSRTGSFGL